MEKWHHRSTSAGAYQITQDTYDDAVQHHAAHDFSESSQDAIAEWVITHRCGGAQWDIWEGKLDTAFIKVDHTWSSLPGGQEQKLTSEEAKKYFWDHLGEAAR